MCKFSLDFRNTSCIISKNISSKVILKYHISMLTCLFRLSQNPFQSNKNCESCITSTYQLEISKICISFFCNCQEHLCKTSLDCIRTMTVSFYVRIGSRALFNFCFFPSLSFFLVFCGVFSLLRYWGKFFNTYNKAV